MKNKLYLTYYGLIIATLISQVIFTIYQTSLVVSHGSQLQALKSEKELTDKKRRQLQTELASSQSINSLTESSQLDEYELIKNPIVVTALQTVASR